uniref:Uncharacterized protein n=1 Tax=Ciona savignyi TaxID=51511 RepID=H2YVA3_CIOSA
MGASNYYRVVWTAWNPNSNPPSDPAVIRATAYVFFQQTRLKLSIPHAHPAVKYRLIIEPVYESFRISSKLEFRLLCLFMASCSK